MAWGHHGLDVIAQRLLRTPDAVYRRAGDLGLGLGCPQGFEYLSNAAKRAGYCVATMRKILVAMNVPMHRTISTPQSPDPIERFVEPCAVDDAVARWVSMETVAHAARRLGIPRPRLAYWLRQDTKRGLVPKRPRRRWCQHRLEPEVYDAIVARWTETESGEKAAQRIGVAWETLRKWLRAANVVRPPTRFWRVNPTVVDRIVMERRAMSKRFAKRAA